MSSPAKPLAFGHDAIARRLIDALGASLRGERRRSTEASLVIGLFGEWGSGKSLLLQAIEAGLPPGDEQHVNVVVPFNAWRFEREPQLLVPLLRVAEQQLRKALDASLGADVPRNEALSDRLVLLGDLAQTVYTHGGRELLQAALTAQAIPLRLPELKPGDGEARPGLLTRWRARREALARARRFDTPISQLNSLYYDFLEHLRAVTGRNPEALAGHRERIKLRGLGWWPRWRYRLASSWRWLLTGETPPEPELQLNLVFLVDDLDRCLPDKAVEVLEAIKLFLEVEGCAFVLALDEEVVERGIAHRYKDYALVGKDGLTPITGAEYLEKLIHLPVRLPRPSAIDAQAYLARRNPALFGREEAPDAPNELALLVAAITPPVPRKLIRMGDLMEMALGLEAGDASLPSRREWLAVVCALQLFAPALYRYLRSRGARLLITLAEWRETARFRDLAALRESLAAELHAVDSAAAVQHGLVLARLPELCEAAMNNRSGFDLLELLARVWVLEQQAPLSAAQLGALMAFTEDKPAREDAPAGLAPAAPETPPIAASASGEAAPVVPASPAATAPEPAIAAAPALLPTAQLENERGLFEALDSGDLNAARLALSREGFALQGRFLPEPFCDDLFAGRLGQRLDEWLSMDAPTDPTSLLLKELLPHLSQRQAYRLIGQFGGRLQRVLRRPSWAEGVDRSDHAQLQAPPLLRDFGAALSTAPDAEDAALTWAVPRGWVCPPVSLPLHSSLVAVSLSSDAEFGVRARLASAVVDGLELGLRWIEPGSFTMGSAPGVPGRHRREGQLRTVSLSRGYWICETACTEALWRALMPQDERDWREDRRSLPVTGVTAAEIEDFLARLQSQLPGSELQLPSEAEWECAARAGTRTAWAFGDRVGAAQVNAESSHRVPVGSLPPNAWGLFEMHGNVAELCRDFLRDEQRAPTQKLDPEGEPGARWGWHALRGGSKRSTFDQTRSAAVDRMGRDKRRDDVGFRFILRAADAVVPA
jgi:formylglycine-generating enzyme required for sulfatase activity